MNDFIAQLKTIVGDAYVLTDPNDTQPYYKEYTGRYKGNGLAVIRPANTQEVSDVVKLCATNNVPIVPQGGNTGLVGGSVAYDDKTLVLSLGRMNKFREVNPDDFTMVVEAGCILEQIQQKAQEHKRYFPLALGAQGSCQIGGNIATNAGGILTIRYGNCRDLVLGLEVVLPNGEIWNGLRSLRKDNTGYNVKQLFIGAEGTLGIITAAVIKIFPDPGLRETFFVGLESLENVLRFLPILRDVFGENILAYEVVSRLALDCTIELNPSAIEPLSVPAPWSLLIEISGGKQGDTLRQQIEDVLAHAFENQLITDATIAQNTEQTRAFWTIRESIPDMLKIRPDRSIKYDASVPIAAMPDFVRDIKSVAQTILPGVDVAVFGHAGDGNLHFNLVKSDQTTLEEYFARRDEVTHIIHDVVQKHNGSFAAEHGIGTFKVEELAKRKSLVELQLMRTIKTALDPQNIMNPGKVLA